MLEQYQDHIWILLQYKMNPQFPREELTNLKSHNCHVLMTQLLLIALRAEGFCLRMSD